jgi:hypothetical protein
MAGLGISRGGIVAQPTGGGAPPGDATIWPFVADWAALSTVAGPLRDGDQVFVQSLGTPASYGLAQYDEGDAEWKLLFAMFASFANMEAFAEPIVTGALAAVEVSGNDDETAVRYQYESGWARTANNQPYVWTSTDPLATQVTDPSGIGVTREGDLLVVTSGSEIQTYRLRVFTTGAGDVVNLTAWIAIDVPTTWRLKSYATGSAAPGGDGWTASGTGTATVTASGGFHVLTGGTGSALLTSVFTPSTTQGVHHFGEFRADTAAAVGRGFQIGDGTNASRIYQIGSGALRLYDHTGLVPISGGAATSATAPTLPGLSSDPSRVDVTDLSPTTWTVTRVAGVRVQTFRRDLITTNPFTANRLVALAGTVLHARNYGVLGP